MLRIGVVGDCSQGDVTLFTKALDTAIAGSDVVVCVGDINSADHTSYNVLKARIAANPNKILAVPGNHDYDYASVTDFFQVYPKQWRKDFPEAVLIGLDNGQDNFGPGWDILNSYANTAPISKPFFLFMHKSPSTIVLPDGTESTHIMGEGSVSPEAEKLKAWISAAGKNVTIVAGHYHAFGLMRTSYGSIILEGRGGSGGYGTPWSPSGNTCGWTQIFVQPEGWTAHSFTLT